VKKRKVLKVRRTFAILNTRINRKKLRFNVAELCWDKKITTTSMMENATKNTSTMFHAISALQKKYAR